MAKQIIVTEEGLKKLQEELEYLKSTKRKEVVEAIRVALSFGDLSENSEYDEAKNEEAKIEMRIHELEEMISVARVIDEAEIDHTKVSVGSIVEVENVDTKVRKTYHIVGSYETDPVAGKISDQSAIGGGIMGTSVGEKVDIELPNGKTLHLVICDVRRANA